MCWLSGVERRARREGQTQPDEHVNGKVGTNLAYCCYLIVGKMRLVRENEGRRYDSLKAFTRVRVQQGGQNYVEEPRSLYVHHHGHTYYKRRGAPGFVRGAVGY